jgi:hypothetical protein
MDVACRNEGEDARLYAAVKAASDFACTWESIFQQGRILSMTQKYPEVRRSCHRDGYHFPVAP